MNNIIPVSRSPLVCLLFISVHWHLSWGRGSSKWMWIVPAEREEEFALTEATPTSPSPGSYSPARSVHSVGVSSASSPAEAASLEYSGVPTTTGEERTQNRLTHSHTHTQVQSHGLKDTPLPCVCIHVYQALFSLIRGPLHTQWRQQAAPLQRPASSFPAWGTAARPLPPPPPTGCRSTHTERSMGNDPADNTLTLSSEGFLSEWILLPLFQLHWELQLRQLPQPAPSLHPEPVSQFGPRAGHQHTPPLLCLPQVVCTGQCRWLKPM